ncbi:MAG: hypothetical protein DRN27_07210 [Thermoplasmata archaeon]|nr:MAG: hypothetical protein DRN27_07210 [Thermoplasmata archaeon]
METKIVLNELQKDALQELANIGASHAATALSQMVNKNITIGIPKVEVVPLDQSINFINDKKEVAGVLLQISNEVPMYILLIVSKESSLYLTSLLMGMEPDSSKESLDEMDQEALKEVGNIMMTSFFNGVTELIGISMIPGPPQIAYDIPKVILETVITQLTDITSDVVLFDSDVGDTENKGFKIDMILLPEPKSIDIILNKLGTLSNNDEIG